MCKCRLQMSHLPSSAEIFVVAGVQRVLAALVSAELQREQRVLTPGHVGVHVDLVQRLGQVREALAPN